MNKPNGYDETQAQGEFIPVELGGHKLVIKQVTETQSKTGKPMVVILFDFADDDKQPHYFMDMYKKDDRPDKKWSNQATQYILAEDNEGKCSKSFKTFTTCVEHSNAGFTTQFNDKFCEQFKNKKIGGVFGEQMDVYQGEEKKKRVLRWFVSNDKVDTAEIPNLSETKTYKEYKEHEKAVAEGGFMNVPNGIDEELPF